MILCWNYRSVCGTNLIFILKGKRNAYFDFQNVGFSIRINFVLIPAIYTHWYRRLNFSTIFFRFCCWRIPLALTSLPRIGVYRLYVKETRARKQIKIEENGALNNFPPSDRQFVNHKRKLLINIPYLQEISMTWIQNSFSTVEWLNNAFVAYCTRLAESF